MDGRENESRDPRPAAPAAAPRRGLARPAAGRAARRGRPPVLPRRRQRPGRPARRGPGRETRRRCRHRRPARRGGAHRAGLGRPGVAPGPAVRHRRLQEGTTPASRSPPSGPRCTGRRAASPRWRSPTTSRPTCPGATSRSTRWRCGFPTRSSSIRSTARPTSPPSVSARRSRPRCRSSTTPCA